MGIRMPEIQFVEKTRQFLNDCREYATGTWVPISYLPWFMKKRWQYLTYTHLSRYVALLLTIVLVTREWDNLWAIATAPRWPRGIEWWILVGLIGTLYAFKLELFDKRRAVSPQELRFQGGVMMLLNELDAFARFRGSKQETEDKFDSFVKRVLEIVAATFTLPHCPRVDSGLMVKIPEEPILKLVKWSRNAKYDPDLTIKLPDENFDDSGPAGVAFVTECLVHLPKKKSKKKGRVWAFKQDETDLHDYWPLGPYYCWTKAKWPWQEDFRTVICAPIKGLGVLNLSTRGRDPFVNRDYVMAQYFAAVLQHATALAHDKNPQTN